MSRKPSKVTSIVKRVTPSARAQPGFEQVLALITASRTRAIAAVNTALIDLYWAIGKYICLKIEKEDWGKGTVEELAGYIRKKEPNASGFSAQNLWRMRQFYETYRHQSILSPLVRELPWTHNLMILSRSKRDEEREFYLRQATTEKWTKRELERQLNGALFERTILTPAKLSPAVTVLHPTAASIFKDSYLLEFLDLPDAHSESDLHRGLIQKLKSFLIELGRDFCYVASEFRVQVGKRDFSLDLLFFHRGLSCLVAFELKTEDFDPEHLGKLEFYLEALDRDVRKPHERPSIGILLCATKDAEVVEYALARATSPAIVAEYQTLLPEKQLLRAKLHEFYLLASQQASNKSPRGSSGKHRRAK